MLEDHDTPTPAPDEDAWSTKTVQAPENTDLAEQLRVARATISAMEETLAERDDDVDRARIDAVAAAAFDKKELADEVTRLRQQAPLYEGRILRLKQRLAALGEDDAEQARDRAGRGTDAPPHSTLPMAELMHTEISRLKQGYVLATRQCDTLEKEIERLRGERNDAVQKTQELKRLFALLESHRPDLFKDLPTD